MPRKPTPLVLAEVKSAGNERELAIAQIAAFLKKNPQSGRHMPQIRQAHSHPATQLQMLVAAAIADDIGNGVQQRRDRSRTFH